MSANRLPGKINSDTTLIDIGMGDIRGVTAVYLIQASRKCLIDGGTRAEASRLINKLKELDAFPPDLIIVTHPHWDHIQGIPLLQEEASRQGKKIEIFASQTAIPLLADASFNNIYERGPCGPIRDVTPVKEGDAIDLGGITLRIYEVPGHCQGHIALLDEKNRNIFVGDALGNKIGDAFFTPPFMPPTWDPDAFLASVNKLKQIHYETLCLAHFGCISGDEARSILDESVDTYNTWWQLYERHADRLSDIDYLLKVMRKEINPVLPEIKPATFKQRFLLSLASAAGSVVGKKTALIDKLALSDLLKWLAAGYRIHKNAP